MISMINYTKTLLHRIRQWFKPRTYFLSFYDLNVSISKEISEELKKNSYEALTGYTIYLSNREYSMAVRELKYDLYDNLDKQYEWAGIPIAFTEKDLLATDKRLRKV